MLIFIYLAYFQSHLREIYTIIRINDEAMMNVTLCSNKLDDL